MFSKSTPKAILLQVFQGPRYCIHMLSIDRCNARSKLIIFLPFVDLKYSSPHALLQVLAIDSLMHASHPSIHTHMTRKHGGRSSLWMSSSISPSSPLFCPNSERLRSTNQLEIIRVIGEPELPVQSAGCCFGNIYRSTGLYGLIL